MAQVNTGFLPEGVYDVLRDIVSRPEVMAGALGAGAGGLYNWSKYRDPVSGAITGGLAGGGLMLASQAYKNRMRKSRGLLDRAYDMFSGS